MPRTFMRPSCRGGLADVNRAVVEDDHDGFGLHARLGAIDLIEGRQKRNEIGAVLGAGSDDDQLVLQPVERPIMATFFDCPGAGTRKSAPRLARARAR